jgi:hypothetical protein
MTASVENAVKEPLAQAAQNPDRWKKLTLVMIMVNTVVVALVASLQVDANIRTRQANRDSQYYAMQVSGELVRQSYQSDYDLATFSQVLKNTQESLVMQYTALEAQSKNNVYGSLVSTIQATVAQARAERAKVFSIFYSDVRYAPVSGEDMPAMQAYLDDQAGVAKAILVKQNKAADDYHRWNGKADDYVAVLAMLAVAFFLLGLGQSTGVRLRLLFAILGAVMIGLGVIWSLVVLIG